MNDKEIADKSLGMIYSILKEWWKFDTCFSSRPEIDHQAYQILIKLGIDIVPYIMHDLENDPWWCTGILYEIFYPAHPDIIKNKEGNLVEISKDWLEFLKEKDLEKRNYEKIEILKNVKSN